MRIFIGVLLNLLISFTYPWSGEVLQKVLIFLRLDMFVINNAHYFSFSAMHTNLVLSFICEESSYINIFSYQWSDLDFFIFVCLSVYLLVVLIQGFSL